MENKINRVIYKNDLSVISKRFVSYLIDWYLGALMSALPLAVVSQKLYGTMAHQNIIYFDEATGMVLGFTSIALALVYYIAIPAFLWSGQTLGKKICHLEIVDQNGTKATKRQLLIRQLVGIILIEGSLYSVSTIIHQLLSIITGFNFITPAMYFGIAISLLSALLLLFGKDQKAIHDHWGRTKVISSK